MAKPLPNSPWPKLPPLMQDAGLGGEVVASFIVDTTGVPDSLSIKVIKSSHQMLTNAVIAKIPAMRFTPAERRGTKVRQLVEMPFKF